jgi:DinB superfamily
MTDAAAVRDRLASFPSKLRATARAATAAAATVELATAEPGEWTPIEIVRHLIAVEEEVWQARLRQLETEEHPRWRWVEPAQWLGAPGADLDVVLDTHREARTSTLAMLDAIPGDGWGRTGTHDTFGVLDVAGLMAVAADHDDEHLETLRRWP